MSGVLDEIDLWEVLDSRGRPTLAAQVRLRDGTIARASVPSGASTGAHEAVERRDGDPSRYQGSGTRNVAAAAVAELRPLLRGMPCEQLRIDEALRAADGTQQLSRLGANSALAVSQAVARAAARASGRPLWCHLNTLLDDGTPARLPVPMINMISGGRHAGTALRVQDYLVETQRAGTFAEALERTVQVRVGLEQLFRERGLSTSKADEGGLAPALEDPDLPWLLLDEAVQLVGLRTGTDIAYCLDMAATQLQSGDGYVLEEAREITALDLVGRVERWAEQHALVSVEDVLGEDDWDGWRSATVALGPRLRLVGDDLFCTRVDRLRYGVDRMCANAILIKMNQAGTVSDTLATLREARAAGYTAVVSARSGETEDTFLADLAVGSGAGHIKVGSVAQSERLAKYNRLLQLEHQTRLPYAGAESR